MERRIAWTTKDMIHPSVGAATIDGFTVTAEILPDYEMPTNDERGTFVNGRERYDHKSRKYVGDRYDWHGAIKYDGALYTTDTRAERKRAHHAGETWDGPHGHFILFRPFDHDAKGDFSHPTSVARILEDEKNDPKNWIGGKQENGYDWARVWRTVAERARLELKIAEGGDNSPVTRYYVALKVSKAGVTLAKGAFGGYEVADRFSAVACKHYPKDFEDIYVQTEEDLDGLLDEAKRKLAELAK